MMGNYLSISLQINQSLKNIRLPEYLIIGVSAGIFLCLVVILFLKMRERKIKNIRDLENNFKLPILTVIPKYNKKLLQVINNSTSTDQSIVSLMETEPAQRESYRNLRTKLINNYPSTLNCILFTSTGEGAGKTTIVANFAVALARLGKRVLVLDCDFKRSKLPQVFKIYQKQIGLADYLTKNIKLILSHPFELSKHKELKIDVIPAGGFRENSSEILGSQSMGELLKIAQYKYDYILLDTPPLSTWVDTFVVCKIVKNVILIIRPKVTVKNSISWALKELEQSGVNVLGFVYNGFNVSKVSYQCQYGYLYAK